MMREFVELAATPRSVENKKPRILRGSRSVGGFRVRPNTAFNATESVSERRTG